MQVIIIGNEILSGRTLDQNSNFIAKRCSDIGIKVKYNNSHSNIKERIIEKC